MKYFLQRHPKKIILIVLIAIIPITRLVQDLIDIIFAKEPYLVCDRSNETYSFQPRAALHALPADDFARLMDLSDFKFLINNFPCNRTNRDPFILILIHSAPNHAIERDTIRKTWGRKQDAICLLFLLADVPSSWQTQSRIRHESDEHRDVIQGNFVDAYTNITYKHVMGLKWAAYFGPRVKYILKTDDDVFVNMPYLLSYLKAKASRCAKDLIFCNLCTHCRVSRSHRSKWRISPLEYSDRYYPPFCLGYVIIYSPDVLFELYEEAQRSKYFRLDDVYVTGILAARKNITHSSLGALVLSYRQMTRAINRDLPDHPFLFGPSQLSTSLIEDLWATIERPSVL